MRIEARISFRLSRAALTLIITNGNSATQIATAKKRCSQLANKRVPPIGKIASFLHFRYKLFVSLSFINTVIVAVVK